ncbi:MAG: enoyl-CoA hydratase [Woeseiaceae bacterium]|nr:enoyl-CoA hydratase [Woeseiaceae bacterium]
MSTSTDPMTAEPVLLRHDEDGIATLTLNRPAKYNALSEDLLISLQDELDQIARSETLRVVIIAANGKAFSAGHDLKEMHANDDRDVHQALFDRCGRMMMSIHRLPQPVIASVHGIATAAGCQLVANCDLAVAAEDARFAVSGINAGLFCSTPAVPLSRNVLPKKAMQMLLTGDFVSAAEAKSLGLVNEVVPPDELHAATRALAEKIAAKSGYSIRLGKDMFYKQLSMELPDAYAFASERMACNMDSHDAREGITAFIEKRRPDWKHK